MGNWEAHLMEIRASLDAATLNLAANVAKSYGKRRGGNGIDAGVCLNERDWVY